METKIPEDVPADVLSALIRDSLTGPHAVLMACAHVSETEFYLASMGRPGVLPPDPGVEHYDHGARPTERRSVVPFDALPEGLEWRPCGDFDIPATGEPGS